MRVADDCGAAVKGFGWIAAAALFLLNAILIQPLFRAGELPYRGSIEAGYASMARFFAANPNPWGWNPLSYCGLPAQFTYLPGLHYLTALFIWMAPGASTDHVYRVVTAVLACLVPVSVFFFARFFTGSLRQGAIAGLLCTFVSTLYGMFPTIEADQGLVRLPWRLQVWVKYGEGPHTAGLALAPLALIAVYLAATKKTFARMSVAAVLLAAVALTNWVAALALAIAVIAMMTAQLGNREFEWWRVLAAGALGYGLACFWLSPTFVHTIVFNWPADAFGYKLAELQRKMLMGWIGGFVAIRLAFVKFPGHRYFCFVVLCAWAFGFVVTGFYQGQADTLPESRRYAIEYEIFLMLAFLEAFRLMFASNWPMMRKCAIAAAVAMLAREIPGAAQFATQGWDRWKLVDRASTVEYGAAEWIAKHAPDGRVFVSGGLRYRLNSWFDIPQVGGVFETGLRNRLPLDYSYQIRTGTASKPGQEAEDAIMELRAAGAEYIAVHGRDSAEYYRDFKNPDEFQGLLERVFSDRDNSVYRVPHSGFAHLVKQGEMPPDVPAGGFHRRLEAYVAAMDDRLRPALKTRWTGASRLEIDGEFPADYLVAVRVNHDEGWRAFQGERELKVNRDEIGFMSLQPGAGKGSIAMEYDGTAEQRQTAFVSFVVFVAMIGGIVAERRNRIAPAA